MSIQIKYTRIYKMNDTLIKEGQTLYYYATPYSTPVAIKGVVKRTTKTLIILQVGGGTNAGYEVRIKKSNMRETGNYTSWSTEIDTAKEEEFAKHIVARKLLRIIDRLRDTIRNNNIDDLRDYNEKMIGGIEEYIMRVKGGF